MCSSHKKSCFRGKQFIQRILTTGTQIKMTKTIIQHTKVSFNKKTKHENHYRA